LLNIKHFHQLTHDREDSVRLLNKPSMRGIRAGIVEKYSEKAHFVYELLQNADDVGATQVRFLLRKNGLYFSHNGTQYFTVTAPDDVQNIGHINAITAIGDSSKKDNSEAKIGKFGIGFKAVFQYTNTPHIYDPNISFKIKDLIVPQLLPQEPHPLRREGDTLFYFPFDRIEKPAQDAVDEIEDKLKHLPFPLLFLRNLKQINWETDNGYKGNYSISDVGFGMSAALRNPKSQIRNESDPPDLSGQALSINGQNGENKDENELQLTLDDIQTHSQTIGKKTMKQAFLRFFRSISENQTVQIIFLLDENGQINNHKKHPAYCFFPTKVMTGLRFLIHAPFLLSDSREGIKQKEKWNEYLVRQLAELAAHSLEQLIHFEAIEQENLFMSLPIERSDLDPLFTPVSDAIIQKMHQVPLLPTAEKIVKVTIKNAFLAENKKAQDLITNEQLEQFFGEGARWIFPDLNPHSKLFPTVKTHLTANQNIVAFDWLSTQLNAQIPNAVETLQFNVSTTAVLENTDTLEFKIVEIWDTLSDEERLKLMQEAEPNATYATWEEVLDYDVVGLDAYLEQPITFERSLYLWHFLIQCFDNQVFNINNFYGNYTFAWQTELHVSFDALYWRRLKNAIWLYDKDGNLLKDTPSVSEAFLHEKYTKNDDLIQHLFSKKEIIIDRFIYLTDEEKRAIDIGKRFLEQGFSTDDLLELRKIKATKLIKENRVGEGLNKIKKDRIKREKITETEENEQISSEVLLKKQQALREELEAELEDKMAQLIEIEQLKNVIKESAQYSMAWFKALLRLEYVLAYEKQEKDRSFKINFDKVEREEGTNKTILLKRPSQHFPSNIEDAGDITLKLQLENERRNLAIEVVSIKETSLRAKLKTPEEIADLDFSKIRGATLEIQNTIFILEELCNAFEDLPFDDAHNVQTNLLKDIRFIFGPPGTGKTTYLAHEEIQPAMLADDPLKILVLTPTNKSADVLVQKTQRICGDSPEWLMRFGTTSEISIENAGLLKDSTYDISGEDHFCVVTTITRFPYDGFNHGSDEYKFKNIAWDVIIVDEASMIGVGYMAYLLLQQPNAQFVIGGDPFQIEPVVSAEDWQGENIYSLVRLTSFDPVVQREMLYPHPYKVTNLTTQYRSISTIGGLYSHFAYDSILRHNRFKEDQKQVNITNLPLKDINIIQFPAHKLEIIYRPLLLNKSHYHIYSALFTVELIQYIAKELNQNQPNDTFKIGIICPYKAQATMVDKIMSGLHVNYKNITIQTGTIHSFQGDECNIVLCLFNPPPNITKSPLSFLNKKNILNVAISRAKDHLILLMPDENTEGFDNLYQIKRLKGIIHYYLAGVCQQWTSREIEEILFGIPDFLYENTFATTHQSVNVYTQPEKKYEIRIEEKAVDVQVHGVISSL
jgi:hypothetical protein